MRLPSIDQLVRQARSSAQRFPLVLLCAATAAAAASLLPDSESDETLIGILYAASLGIPLFFAIGLVAERRWTSGARAWAARGLALALLVALYFSTLTWSDQVQGLRYVQLSLAAHLLVAFAPYARVREWNGFWQYNRALLLRFLLAGVFSFVLWVGLSIALAAIDNLLGVNVAENTYFRLWCWIAFLFNTWFFAAGVPDDFEALERETDYPGVFKVFAQYILSPLVTVYILILLVYLGRVLVTRVWPSGWIGYLVSSVAAAGILSLLLLYPVEERAENRWVSQYARWFWVGLVPAIVMLLLAAWKRIQQYAVTEPRYFLVILAAWLGGISLFYIITRSRNIKVIPATLAALAVLTFAGPWSAFAVSRRSQTARLQGLLERNGMLVEGVAGQPTAEVPAEDRREISAVLRYLIRNHGTASIAPWFPEGRLAEVDTIAAGTAPGDRSEADERAALIAGALGIDYVGSWMPGEGERFDFSIERGDPPLDISGYDYVLRDQGAVSDTAFVPDSPYAFTYEEEDDLAILVLRDGEQVASLSLTPLIERVLEYARTTGSRRLPVELMTLTEEVGDMRLLVAVSSIGGSTAEEEEGPPYEIWRLSADYFFTLAPAGEGEQEAPNPRAP